MKALALLLCTALPAIAQLGTTPGGSLSWHGWRVSSGGASVATNYNDLLFQWKASGSSSSSGTTYSTGSFQPATNALVLVAVANTKASAADTPNAPTGNNLTYVLVTNCPYGTSSTNKITLFMGQGATPTSGALTVTFGATETSCLIEVVELQGADATAANGAGALVKSYTNGTTAASSNPTISFTAPSAIGTNALVWFIADNVNDTSSLTANTNWIRYEKIAHGSRVQGLSPHFQMQALNTSSATSVATSRVWGGVAIEVKPGLEANPLSRPTLVQRIDFSYTQITSAPWVTNMFANFGMKTLSGNTLVAYVAYQLGASVAITDDQANNWNSVYIFTNSQNTVVHNYLIATNAAANTLAVKFAFASTNMSLFRGNLSEYANVLSFSPLDVKNAQTAVGVANGGTVSTTAFTTTADGDLIIYDVVDVTSGVFSQGTPFSGPSLGYGLQTQLSDERISAYGGIGVQSKGGAWNPSVWVFGGAEFFDNIAIALKRAQAGTLPSTTSKQLFHIYETATQGGSPDKIYLNGYGKLQVLLVDGFGSLAGGYGLTNLQDVVGNTWYAITVTNNGPSLYVCSNYVARINPPNILSFTKGPSINPNVFIYDVLNASSFPMTFSAETNYTQSGNNADAYCVSFQPGEANDLAIECTSFGTGPAYATIGSGYIYDAPYYWGQQDTDTLAGGDAYAHYWSPDTATVFFKLSMTNNATSGASSKGGLFR